ncbi:MAG: tRNA (adenosine(37)-N6)-dimethylallyltransferase MiaA [bacterium]
MERFGFDAVVITGPTCAGKTGLSIEAAKAHGCEIISMDSRLVYRGLNVGTDKPAPEHLAAVPHHLIDAAEPGERFTAADFTATCARLAAEIRSRGKLPLIVGGTCLYLKALRGGYSFHGADRDPALREELKREAALRGVNALHSELARIDPRTAARLHPSDERRIIRALEVFHLTGRLPSRTRREERNPAGPPLNLIVVAMYVERKYLYERINKRVDRMYNSGLIEETRGLIEARPGLEEWLAGVIGYAQCLKVLAGGTAESEAREETKKQTRRLSRSQMTWLRRMDEVVWVRAGAVTGGALLNEIGKACC